MKINTHQIMLKADAIARMSDTFKKKANAAMDDYMMEESWSGSKPDGPHTVVDAALKFANLLLHNIYAQKFGENLEERLEHVDVGKPIKVGPGKYYINVYFEDDLQRDSMSHLKDYPQVNLAYLYSDGVDHIMPQIWEWDKSTKTLRVSNPYIPHTGFLEQTIDDFMGNYAYEYNVTNVEIIENEGVG